MAENIAVASSEFWKVDHCNGTTNTNSNSYFVCNVCRLCANVSDNVVPIFDGKLDDVEKNSILAKLKKCLPSILVFENDMKPKQICVSCVSKLDACVSFMDMTREADSKFETLLQNKAVMAPVFANFNEAAAAMSWFPISVKQENLTIIKTDECVKDDQVDFASTEFLRQLCQQQQRTFSQHVISAPVSVSTTSHDVGGGGSVNHSILQNLLTQDNSAVVGPQDVVVLVEVKCKDLVTSSNSVATLSKPKTEPLPIAQNAIVPSTKVGFETTTTTTTNPLQTKIVDTSGHIRIINLADFDGKFNQFDKIAASFVTGDQVTPAEKTSTTTSTPSNGIVPLLKNFESDVLSMLKLDMADPFKSLSTKSTSVMSPATSSVPATTLLDSAKQCGRGFRCEVCGKQFTRKNRLTAHEARHSSERPHSCDKCDQRFITRWDLTLHLRIHSGMFSCEFCGKAFPAKGKLDRHRRTHTGERPFPCTVCNRAFSENRNLRNHMKTHEDERKNSNGSCSVCGCWLSNANSSDDSVDGSTCRACCDSRTLVNLTNVEGITEADSIG